MSFGARFPISTRNPRNDRSKSVDAVEHDAIQAEEHRHDDANSNERKRQQEQ
ncbi:MAG: hypothetical protein MK213_07045 [Planctomycetes bacterium]|nr:hypothetical protein [Planctomycetota bacterium]